MRVLQLISSAGHYGAENMLLQLTKALGGLGCRSVVGVFENGHCPNTEVAYKARQHGLAVTMIPCQGRADWSAARRIRDCIHEQAIDLVHTHGYKADIYGYAARKALSIPIVATCHNWTNRTASLRLYAILDRVVLRSFDKVVPVSEGVASSLRRFGIPSERIVSILNGIELSLFEAARPTLAEEIGKGGGLVVGMVGRLVSAKGPEVFLRAAREVLIRFPETLFVLVGDGPARQVLEELARKGGIDRNVIFAGQRSDMPGVYASMDIIVLPSLNEGMPMTILEAMAAKRPVIATRVGSVPQLILPGRTGLLVAPGDSSALGDALNKLLADPQLRQELGSQGRAWVERHFAAEVMARSYLSLYQELVNRRAAA